MLIETPRRAYGLGSVRLTIGKAVFSGSSSGKGSLMIEPSLCLPSCRVSGLPFCGPVLNSNICFWSQILSAITRLCPSRTLSLKEPLIRNPVPEHQVRHSRSAAWECYTQSRALCCDLARRSGLDFSGNEACLGLHQANNHPGTASQSCFSGYTKPRLCDQYQDPMDWVKKQ